ncbi:MAG TPA: hypothetical protein VF577_04150 [Allosphingosinicella sp.]|jgi:hypothetical protein
MRLIGGFFFAVLLLGGFITRPGGGLASPSGSGGDSRNHSSQVAAAPSDVMAAVSESLAADGLEIVSRADDGVRLRAVIASTALSGDPEFAPLSRYGDMIITARVGASDAEVTAGFAMKETAAHYRITAAPAGDGKGSIVTMEASVEEGSGRDSRRVARGLRTVIDRSGRNLLDRVTAAAG